MANDGVKIVLTLKQLISGSDLPTGQTKTNAPSDPNYIAPFTDLTACPVSYTTTCPVLFATGTASSLIFEFSLFTSVVTNPALTGVRLLAISQSAIKGFSDFTFPHVPATYFASSIGLTPGTYTASISYQSGSTTVASCSYTGSYIVT